MGPKFGEECNSQIAISITPDPLTDAVKPKAAASLENWAHPWCAAAIIVMATTDPACAESACHLMIRALERLLLARGRQSARRSVTNLSRHRSPSVPLTVGLGR